MHVNWTGVLYDGKVPQNSISFWHDIAQYEDMSCACSFKKLADFAIAC